MKKSFTKKGFTLIELLVVIAIIGLLASIVFAGLGTARKNGRITAAQGNLRNIFTGWVVCSDGGGYLNLPTETNNGGGGAICTTAATASVYPTLPVGWGFCDGSAVTTTCPAADLTTGPVSLATAATAMKLMAQGDGVIITCTEDGCVKS